MRRLLAALPLILAFAAPAAAADCYPSAANASQADCGSVGMHLDGSGNAVPDSAAAPKPVTVIGTTGTTPAPFVPAVSTLTTSITRPADTNAYAANDAFANSTSAPTTGGFTFTAACRASGGYGTITDMVVSASAGTAYQGEVWIFDQAVTATNDNAALSVSDADILNFVGAIPFNTTDVNAANSVSTTTGIGMGYTCVGTANLRYLVKIMNAPTPASAEVLTVRIKVQN